MYARPTIPSSTLLTESTFLHSFTCSTGPCLRCLERSLRKQKMENSEVMGKEGEGGDNEEDEEEDFCVKENLINSTIELLRSRSTRKKRSRRKRKDTYNSNNTYVVMDYRLHCGTGPSIEYLITRDGDDNGGRWVSVSFSF